MNEASGATEHMREKSVTADGMQIDWDVPIPMDDGIVLRADVFRPLAAGRFPILLTCGPYAKGLPFQTGYKDQWESMVRNYPEVTAGSSNKYQNWETPDPEKWVPEGYVVIRVDSRGAGRSPGVMDFFSPRETRDLYACIEWAAAQPWSSGKVGLLGISYYAMNAWQVAALHPPHLAAICAWEGASDFYRGLLRHGGILNDFWRQWMQGQVARVQHGVGRRGATDPNSGLLVAGPETLSEEELAQNRVNLWQRAAEHPLDDAFYHQLTPDLSQVTVPLLTAPNWGGHGLLNRGGFEGFTHSASRQKWLEVHGLDHWTSFYLDYARALQKRFMDHFLKGADNGWPDQPAVLLHVRHVDRFVQRAEHEWPLARTRWTKIYLDPAKLQLAWDRVSAEHSVTYEAMSEGVTFLSAPLERETELTGPVAIKLFLASDRTDADIFATLRVFGPDGREVDFQGALDPHTPIGNGWLRASHRKLDAERSTPYRPYHTHDEPQPLFRGQVVELDIEVWPTSIVVPVGYRIALTIAGRDFERPGPAARLGTVPVAMRGSGAFTHTHQGDRPPEIFAGRHTLYGGGDRSSYLLLPVIPEI